MEKPHRGFELSNRATSVPSIYFPAETLSLINPAPYIFHRRRKPAAFLGSNCTEKILRAFPPPRRAGLFYFLKAWGLFIVLS